MSEPILYGYWRSSASWRVRIALSLKGIAYTQQPVNLVAGEQLQDEYAVLNPQLLVPTFRDTDGMALSQSVAIIEYLETTRPAPPLLPSDPGQAAKARAFAQIIAADIHPLQNLRVMKRLKHDLAQGQDGAESWNRHWIALGFETLEIIAAERTTPMLFGIEPGYAECFLVPQAYNARRYDVDMSQYPALVDVLARCAEHPAIAAADATAQPDAPQSA